MERAICDEAKVAEHHKFKCFSCGGRLYVNNQYKYTGNIKKGLPVVRKGEQGKFGYQSHSYCYYCAKQKLINDEETIKEMMRVHKATKKKFKVVEKECMKALILDKLEREKT